MVGRKTAEMGDEERKSAGTVIYCDGQGERARKRRAAFFRRKQGQRGPEGGKQQIQGREQKRDNARASAQSNRKAPHRSEGFS